MDRTDEVSVVEKLQSMDFGDMNEFLASLETLSFMEVVTYRSKILEEIDRWKSCRAALDAIQALQADDKLMKALRSENTLSEYDFKDLNKFNAQYETNLGHLMTVGQKLNEIIKTHGTEMNSSDFMTHQMIDLIQKKIQRIPENQPNRGLEIKRLQVFSDALAHRSNFKFIFDKIDQNEERNSKALRKVMRNDLTLLYVNRKTKTIKELCRAYSEDMIYKLVEILRKTFSNHDLCVYVMLWHLNQLRTKSVEGEAWVKVFVLNLTDIYNGIYDIQPADIFTGLHDIKLSEAEAYLQSVSTILDVIKSELAGADMYVFIDPTKVPSFVTNFGLNKPKKKEESSMGPNDKTNELPVLADGEVPTGPESEANGKEE